MSQDFTLSSILSTLYIAHIFHIFGKKAKNLLPNIPVSTLLFVNDCLFISQKENYEKSNANLFYSYSIIFSLFEQFGLTIEYKKSKIL